MASPNKYGNKKIKAYGVTFDSMLEKHCYDLLSKFKIDFVFKPRVELQRSFEFNLTTYRAIEMVPDFKISFGNNIIYLDTKGYATAESKLKYKMLAFLLNEEEISSKLETGYEIIWLKTKEEVNRFVMKLAHELKSNQEKSTI